MIIHKNGFNYCTAEQMTIRLTDTAELDAAAKFAIERLYNVPLDAWTFVVMNRETLCVNKAHPKAERLLELATRFMEIDPEHVESDLIYNEVKKIAGDSAIDALCRIWLSWQKERLSYLNHVRAVDFVERTREKKRDALENDGAFPTLIMISCTQSASFRTAPKKQTRWYTFTVWGCSNGHAERACRHDRQHERRAVYAVFHKGDTRPGDAGGGRWYFGKRRTSRRGRLSRSI